ncbi:hypothetical protein [Halobellus marinus]|uniref:hypothetical protein n=1 Tax=Halobellus TaxID=1073986 RepID=UPI0028AF81BB|nr:hypothetical protein [Halobellus sp. DFY28]
MSPVELAARLIGLLVALAGGVLAWAGLRAFTAAFRGVELFARGDVGTVVGAVGVGLLLAGVAVLVDRGRSVAVSVGGAALVAAVLLVVIDTPATVSVLGMGAVSAAALLAGASIGRSRA